MFVSKTKQSDELDLFADDQDQSSRFFEFPPLDDFPLSPQEPAFILKKRPHSPSSPSNPPKKTAQQRNSDICASDITKAKPESLDTTAPTTKPATKAHIAAPAETDSKPAAKRDTQKSECKEEDVPASSKSSEILAAGALASFAVRAVSASTTSQTSTTTESGDNEDVASLDGSTKETASYGGRDPSIVIDLVPANDNKSMLSDYNNILVRNIELFHPAKSHVNYENLSGSKNTANMSKTRLGLRCIHCKDSPTHITAAAFFPSSIGSIASGLGTIGNRHFGLGKCPNAHPDMVQQLIDTKKSSSMQTRTNGRIGLDAYCRNIAQQYGIFEDDVSGVCWVDGKDHPTIEVDRSSIASVLAGMKHDTNIGMRFFVPSEMNCFWECSGCRSVDIPFRARGSVVFSVEEPTCDMVEDHLKICNGSKPLLVPRNAAIEPFYDQRNGQLPPIKVKWESDKSKLKDTKSRRKKAAAASNVPDGLDNDPLCFDSDRPFTTDFAFFTVSQLRRCFLTKTGGSRGACPVGYAGLACTHCAGDNNERRFFYSTSDQMRNSFSHIPSHLATCEKCPESIKTKLEEFKKVRSRQKSLLKPGAHKVFIDRVWDRMHNGSSVKSVSDAASTSSKKELADVSNVLHELDVADKLLFKTSPLSLVQEDDRNLSSDLTFFTLLQVTPYTMLSSSGGDSDDDSREIIGFPGLVCCHCNSRKFFTTSSEHLSGLLLTISNHMQTCQSCPKSVRNLVTRFRGTHEKQLKRISSSDHAKCLNNIWERLVKASRSKEKVKRINRKPLPPTDNEESVCYLPVDKTKPLVTSEDAALVTDFTYFTMQQVRPTNLDRAENGARTQFADGFPGLECIHCADTPSNRKFFYRTVEILAGNYAHIPNHISTCTFCPTDVKAALAEKKDEHNRLKHKLDRGSQKKFFSNIWERLHACKR